MAGLGESKACIHTGFNTVRAHSRQEGRKAVFFPSNSSKFLMRSQVRTAAMLKSTKMKMRVSLPNGGGVCRSGDEIQNDWWKQLQKYKRWIRRGEGRWVLILDSQQQLWPKTRVGEDTKIDNLFIMFTIKTKSWLFQSTSWLKVLSFTQASTWTSPALDSIFAQFVWSLIFQTVKITPSVNIGVFEEEEKLLYEWRPRGWRSRKSQKNMALSSSGVKTEINLDSKNKTKNLKEYLHYIWHLQRVKMNTHTHTHRHEEVEGGLKTDLPSWGSPCTGKAGRAEAVSVDSLLLLPPQDLMNPERKNKREKKHRRWSMWYIVNKSA